MADEYIKRSQAIKELTNAYEYEYPTASGAFDEFATTIVPNVLRNIPAADVVEVVHGRWIESYNPLGFDEVKCAECSSCGEDWIMGDDECIYDYIVHWKYCPSCGAKMDGDENG